MPLMTRRSSTRSTPRTSVGTNGSIRFHCSSLSQNKFLLTISNLSAKESLGHGLMSFERKLAINILDSRKVDLLKRHGLIMAVLCVELNNEVKNIQIMLHIGCL